MWAGATILTAAFTFAAVQEAQQPALPDGPGKAILERACSNCHGLDVVTKYNLPTRNEYADIVSSMIGAGAIVSKQEEPVLVDYLFATLGQKPKPAASDEAAKTLVETACTSCHGLEGMKNHVYDKAEDYGSLVKSMIDYGATIPADQLPAVVDYLFKTYGKK
jgi:cytochrome c5